MKKALSILIVLLASVALFANGSAETYPSKDIQMICNSGAGGGTDTIVRQVSLLAEKELGGSFYVVNKSDGVEAVGPSLVMQAKPDGYTVGNINYGSVVNAVYNSLIPGYDLNKLNIFALITKENDALMVGKDSPYKTFDELIAAAKANPGKIRIGDQGVGGRVYLLATKLEDMFGVKFNKISYQSSAAQREAILNKEIDAAITSMGDFASLLNSGDAVALVEFSNQRNAAYPDVPTILELGYDDSLLSSSFIGMACPKDTPAEIVTALENAFEKAVTSQEFVDWCDSIGVQAAFMKGQELQDYIKGVQEGEFAALDQLKEAGIL